MWLTNCIRQPWGASPSYVPIVHGVQTGCTNFIVYSECPSAGLTDVTGPGYGGPSESSVSTFPLKIMGGGGGGGGGGGCSTSPEFV